MWTGPWRVLDLVDAVISGNVGGCACGRTAVHSPARQTCGRTLDGGRPGYAGVVAFGFASDPLLAPAEASDFELLADSFFVDSPFAPDSVLEELSDLASDELDSADAALGSAPRLSLR